MSKNRDILILQTSPEELRLVSARIRQDHAELSRATTFRCTAQGDDTPALRDSATLDALASHVNQNGWTGRDVVFLLGGPTVGCMHFDLPPLKEPALRQAVVLKLGQQLHFDVSKAALAIGAPVPSPFGDGTQIRVDVTVADHELVNLAVESAAKAGLMPIAVSATPAAMSALASGCRQVGRDFQAILFLEEKASTLVVLGGDAPFVTTELPMGTADLTAALMRPIVSGENVIQLDEPAAVALRDEIGIPEMEQPIAKLQIIGERVLPLLEPVLQKFAKQVTQWLAFATTCNGNVPISSVILRGPGAGLPGLATALATRLNLDVTPMPTGSDDISLGEGMEGLSAESFAACAAASRMWTKLPDLMPPPVRRRRRVAQARRLLGECGPIIAAAVFALAILFGRIERDAKREISARRLQLSTMNELVGRNALWAAERNQARRISEELESFCRNTPSWIGVFKELSLMLPAELRALEYNGQLTSAGFGLVVRAGVHPDKTGRSFDEVVSQVVLILQRSAFFRRVEMSASRGQQSEDPTAAGVVSIQLDVCGVQPKAKV
jgi:Tfp pilus assembly PilM family ATPase